MYPHSLKMGKIQPGLIIRMASKRQKNVLKSEFSDQPHYVYFQAAGFHFTKAGQYIISQPQEPDPSAFQSVMSSKISCL